MIRGVNISGSTIEKSQVVKLVSWSEGVPLVDICLQGEQPFGVALTDGLPSRSINILRSGTQYFPGIFFSENDILFVGATPGVLTDTAGPYYLKVGVVTYSDGMGSTLQIDLLEDVIPAVGSAIQDIIDTSLTYNPIGPVLSRSALTGDATAPTGSNTLTLATVNSNIGSFGLSNSVPQFVVNAKGLVTSASNVLISIVSSQVSNFVSAAISAVTGIINATLLYSAGALGINLGNANNWTAQQNFSQSTGVGTTSPASKLDVTTNSLGTTQTDSSGIVLANNTAASAGSQQISPAIRLRGQGWKTDATAGSQVVDFRLYSLPVQGTANPTANLLLQYSVNGGAYTTLLTLSSAGTGTFTGNVTASAVTATNINNGFILSGIGRLRSAGADGVWRITNNAETGFGRLILGASANTNPAIKRNGAGIDIVLGDDSGYADIAAARIVANNVVRLKGYTVATLPTGTVGDTAYVTDALAPAYLAAVVGGGTVVAPVFYNGTSWVCH